MKHQGLEARLKKLLLDPNASVRSRVEAVAVMEACELWNLLPNLAKLALKDTEPHELRVRIAEAISKSGDTSAKKKLKGLAVGQIGGDPENKLRAAALRACWPREITAAELFRSLEPAKCGNTEYEIFLSRDLVECSAPIV